MPNSDNNKRLNKRKRYTVEFPIDYNFKKFEEREWLKKLNSSCLALQTYVAGEHSLTRDQFEDMVGDYFYPNPVPPPLVIRAEEITNWLAQTAPTIMEWAFDDNEKKSNQDIEYHFSNTGHGHKPKKTSNDVAFGQYSGTLFGGITCIFPDVREFHFYKALEDRGYTLAFIGVGTSRNVDYLGNTSELFP